jgi:hypothetical protein
MIAAHNTTFLIVRDEAPTPDLESLSDGDRHHAVLAHFSGANLFDPQLGELPSFGGNLRWRRAGELLAKGERPVAFVQKLVVTVFTDFRGNPMMTDAEMESLREIILTKQLDILEKMMLG